MTQEVNKAMLFDRTIRRSVSIAAALGYDFGKMSACCLVVI